MANDAKHAGLPWPVRNARFTVPIPFLDADGDPTDPITPDTEISKDGAAFSDATEEVTTVTGSNGSGYITLTGAEMDAALVQVAAKAASGPKATLAMICPRALPVLATGTAAAGGAGTITLADTVNRVGCIVKTTGGTGGGGTGGANNQARMVISQAGAVATVSPDWETAPDDTTTYAVLGTEFAVNVMRGNITEVANTTQTPRDLGAMADVATSTRLAPTTAGRTLDVSAGGEAGIDLSNVGSPSSVVNFTGVTIKAVTDGVDVDTASEDAIASAAAAAVWASGSRTLTSFGTLAADVASAVWAAATSGMSVVGSIGEKLKTWVLGSDHKAVLSADPHTGATIPAVTSLTNAPPDSAGVLTLLQQVPDLATEANVNAVGALVANTATAADLAAMAVIAKYLQDLSRGETRRWYDPENKITWLITKSPDNGAIILKKELNTVNAAGVDVALPKPLGNELLVEKADIAGV